MGEFVRVCGVRRGEFVGVWRVNRRTFLEVSLLAGGFAIFGIQGGEGAYVIVYRPEHLLGRYQETGHLPYRHFEIHLGEFE